MMQECLGFCQNKVARALTSRYFVCVSINFHFVLGYHKEVWRAIELLRYVVQWFQGTTLADHEEGLMLESIKRFDPNPGVFINAE